MNRTDVSVMEVLKRKFYYPGLEVDMYEAGVDSTIAGLVYDARNQAGLSQKELAERANLPESVIDDLEEADYEGDRLAALVQIAYALGRKVDIRFVPVDDKKDVKPTISTK